MFSTASKPKTLVTFESPLSTVKVTLISLLSLKDVCESKDLSDDISCSCKI